jgi:succinate dehydrogenase/fumarate reductase flavoprotein subunit
MQQTAHDVVILGTGLAGLRAAVEICIRTRGTADIAIVCARIRCARKGAPPR